MATKETKFFKLGEKATLFYDAATKKKIVGGQIVEFDVKDMNSQKFKESFQGGHIKEASSDEVKKAQSDDEPGELDNFSKLTKDKMIARINDEYELNDDEQKALSGMTKDQLVAKYKELYETAEEEED